MWKVVLSRCNTKSAKYNSKKVIADGEVFDSKAEYGVYVTLKALQKVGKISGLTLHPKFELLPPLYVTKIVQLKTKIKEVQRVDESAIHYTADFQFNEKGKIVVMEVKSKATKQARDYSLRRKLIKHKLRQLSQEQGIEYEFREVVK